MAVRKPFTINPQYQNPFKPTVTGPANYWAGLTPQNWLSYAYNQSSQGGLYNNGTLEFSKNKDGSLAYGGSIAGPNGVSTFKEDSRNGIFHAVFFNGEKSPAGLLPAKQGWLTPEQLGFKVKQNADGSRDWSGKLDGAQYKIHVAKGDEARINPAAMEPVVVKNAPAAPPPKLRPDVPQARPPAGNALVDANAPGADPAAAAQLAALKQQNQGVVAALQKLYQEFEASLQAFRDAAAPGADDARNA